MGGTIVGLARTGRRQSKHVPEMKAPKFIFLAVSGFGFAIGPLYFHAIGVN